jgi:hypothetical protein
VNLLLTSTGLSTKKLENTFKSLIIKPPEENKAIIMGIHPGLKDFDFDAYIQRNLQMLVKKDSKKKT